MNDKIEELKNNFRKEKLKMTFARINIIKQIVEINDHFNADDIYDELKERQSKISRASVYRTIALLLKNGLIKEVPHNDKKTKYEFVKDDTHHDHMICIRCGRIIEFKNDDIEYMQKKVCEKYDFILKEHNMELRGLCKKCYEKRKK